MEKFTEKGCLNSTQKREQDGGFFDYRKMTHTKQGVMTMTTKQNEKPEGCQQNFPEAWAMRILKEVGSVENLKSSGQGKTILLGFGRQGGKRYLGSLFGFSKSQWAGGPAEESELASLTSGRHAFASVTSINSAINGRR